MVRLEKMDRGRYAFKDRDGMRFTASTLPYGGWKVVNDRGQYVGDYATMADIRASF